ncbi:MAG TPA: phosphotransferase [Candidatus Binatia bacterium]|jgi:aminoglycoside phosphotransferase (APT) family kinase protein|nr:phosphotransferase [Candidatus Binatia bacterium]
MLGRQRDLDAVHAALTGWLASKLPEARDVALSSLKAPKAGVSNETFLFEITYTLDGRPRRERLVARLQPTDFLVFPEYDLRSQYTIMERLAGSGVPVPRVRWLELDTSVLGSAFYVMDAIDGEVPSEVPSYHVFGWVRDAEPARRPGIYWNGLEAMAKVHALDWRAHGLDFLGVPGPGADPITRQLDYYERFLGWVCEDGPPQPTLEAGLAWLRANAFTPRRVGLCWGDSRMPNLMFRDDRVVAVLDWEMAFLGDPESDLGWWCFLDWANNEGYGAPHLDGIPGKEETLARYAELTGYPVEHAHWHEAFAAFRYGVIMARVAVRLEAIGATIPSPDFATNNVPTQALARLLDLPPPGDARMTTTIAVRDADAPVHLQFRLSGDGGGDWYVVIHRGEGTRHQGVVETADATLTAVHADWYAVQTGELDRLAAYMDGKIKIEGDLTLFMLHEELIGRLGRKD